MYDECTGELVPLEWERILPSGKVQIETCSSDDMASEVFPMLSELADVYKSHGTLPTAGGWLDQPARLILGMKLAHTAREAVAKRIEAKRASA